MSVPNKLLQARLWALGFDPGPIDGVVGPKTRRAQAAAESAQAAKGRPLVHPSGIQRVHCHWTAGTYKASLRDQKHYHALIEGDGVVLRPHNPATKLAHTLNANGGAIGVSLCAMAGAQERPLVVGKYPIKAYQLAVMARVVKEFCATYDIPITPWSVLTHAEVEPTLRIKQRGKIDIMWLPGMTKMDNPIEVGDRLRTMVRKVVL